MYRKSRFISLFLVAGIVIACCLTGCRKKDIPLRLNKPRNIRGVVSYERSFSDLSERHLKVTQAIDIRPLTSREEAEELKEKLQHIAANDLYAVDSLTRSTPYLTPGAATLLGTIGYSFLDSLIAKGLNPDRITVTSVLRTEDNVKRLRRRNANVSENSAHFYDTTFDVS